ncbi:glycerate kinase [Bacillus ectoiniformans]|uniref:glycerate kinase n=1 Tax=Bacillus ectoiniformans TaxID=1494429 RepID=UPI00195B8BAE|nr:glycerate kinase [Bacillus ectoiniformans]MBM7649264.1 glycerate kinase [Bacillus ectoiniformans]
MRVIAAFDSFKGSMSSQRANEAAERALREAGINKIECIPIADGGEGLTDALLASVGGEKITVRAQDPLGRRIDAFYGWVEEEKLAIIEMAAASGLPHLRADELNPYEASTFGTGQLVQAALDRGARKIIIGLGGSATVDGGTGCLEALGIRFLDEQNKELRGTGGSLHKIKAIDRTVLDPRLAETEVVIASDVTNPLTGREGAVHIFGPQKGIKPDELHTFDEAMQQYQRVAEAAMGMSTGNEPGTGAAGGLGFALRTFLNGTFISGAELIIQLANIEEKVQQADLILTGEGKFDTQSLFGKAPIGICQLAKKHCVPAIVFAGKVEFEEMSIPSHGVSLLVPMVDSVISLDEAMENGAELLSRAVKRTVTAIQIGEGLKKSKC